MKTYRVNASYTVDSYVDIQAASSEDARSIAEDMDGDAFTEDGGVHDWNIWSVDLLETNEVTND